MNSEPRGQRFADTLSNLVLHDVLLPSEHSAETAESIRKDFRFVASLNASELAGLCDFANTHHVLVRLLVALQDMSTVEEQGMPSSAAERKATEVTHIQKALDQLHPICEALEAHGGKAVVIKSLDHWPDIGSDLDLYTTHDANRVQQIMREEFNATPVERSWGDRLANKWNFQVPGLDELLEIHVRYLGQTGEHTALARRVVERRVTKPLGGHTFYVPAPEERIIISTLQRMYRHFYFRLCDMVDMSSLLQSKSVNFAELERAADSGGIWPGVEAFLLLVSKYVASFGIQLELPHSVADSQNFSQVKVRLENGFLRVPKLPAAGLFSKQLLSAGVHRDLRAMFRLPLLPPLAISALVAYRLTGSDKGVW